MRLGFLGLWFILFSIWGCQENSKYIYNQGYVYGTVYHIVYESPHGTDYDGEIREELQRYNRIFSTFDSTSVISRVNNNQPVEPDLLFWNCFNRAMEVSEITGGAFDITAGPMVNAWGFGPEARKNMTQERVDSLKQITGYRKVSVQAGRIVKADERMKLDMSAIAKGYTCDLLSDFLIRKGCENYMVEIGGEVVAKGKNEKEHTWTIGISRPDETDLFSTKGLQAKVHLPRHALATSGNYRNFYEVDGKKYAHTIDPATGYPVQHSLLSATVLADNCMDADAFATAFMVLGLEKSVEISKRIPGIEVYFIYADAQGTNQVYLSEGFKQHLTE
jgi:FAD:protein FMN transferase